MGGMWKGVVAEGGGESGEAVTRGMFDGSGKKIFRDASVGVEGFSTGNIVRYITAFLSLPPIFTNLF